MVHIRQPLPQTPEGTVDIDTWIQLLGLPAHFNIPLIQAACQLANLTGKDQSTRFGSNCFQEGLELAEIIAELQLDSEAIATAIIYSTVKNTDLSFDVVEAELGHSISQLLQGLLQMGMLNLSTQKQEKQTTQQLDNIRKMLLAMVKDVRVVVIKLAERIAIMRSLKNYSPEMRHHLAQETMNIYAPLANRLGLHRIKWELEDLAFLQLEPDTYKKIAKGLDERRTDRELRVELIVNILSKALNNIGIDAKVYGRAKHIYSIKRKMVRKNVQLSKIYDAIAVRILVPTVKDCYTALSIVHEFWKPIPEEFDDYIISPKTNGYQSLHTAVIDHKNKQFEVQIRTNKMHEESELGIAAHWKYKEGKQIQSNYERKIRWLREILAWQKEIAQDKNLPSELEKNIFDDRIYVFTPTDDIVDLPIGATPLDFAYHIHTEIGHNCRGAKINNKIVPLTYQLKTGDKIEILTTKHGEPSRDWLNSHNGYLKTSSAKAKISQWFKRQDYKKHVAHGREMLEQELIRLNLPHVKLADITSKLSFKAVDLMLAALGSNKIKLANITRTIQVAAPTPASEHPPLTLFPTKSGNKKDLITVKGLDKLLSKIAKCCKPIPGDPIKGYITRTQGITIHHQKCKNIQHIQQTNPERLIEIEWNSETSSHYSVDIEIIAYEKVDLLKNLLAVLANEKINLINLNTFQSKKNNTFKIVLTIELTALESLHKLITQIQQFPSVSSVSRLQ